MNSATEASPKKAASTARLAAVFIGSFLAVIAIGFLIGIRLIPGSYHYQSWWKGEAQRIDVPSIAEISDQGEYLRIKDSDVLSPREGEDFLLSAWFRFRHLPAPGQRMVLLGKYDPAAAFRPGYALAISRERDTLRPAVYWQAPNGYAEHKSGAWYLFSDLKITPHTWVLFALSFKAGKFLGLHAATVRDTGESEVRLLGGYQLEKQYPTSNADLLFGAFSNNLFRGRIGPIGVYSSKKLEVRMSQVLSDAVLHPAEPARNIPSDAIRFWTADGRSDSASNSHRIEVIRARRAERNRSREQNED